MNKDRTPHRILCTVLQDLGLADHERYQGKNQADHGVVEGWTANHMELWSESAL